MAKSKRKQKLNATGEKELSAWKGTVKVDAKPGRQRGKAETDSEGKKGQFAANVYRCRCENSKW